MINKSILLFTLPRGGSSIVSRILQVMCASHGMTIRDIAQENYNSGISIQNVSKDLWDNLNPESYSYGPFREIPNYFWDLDLSNFCNIILVRDPRDCIVSSYFAIKHLHTIFESGTPLAEMKIGRDVIDTIDEYTLGMVYYYKSRFVDFCRLLARYPYSIICRYEDIYIDPLNWVNLMIKKLALNVAEHDLAQAITEANFTTVEERPNEHKRKGTPGDHIVKLKPATREVVSTVLLEELKTFGYWPSLREMPSWPIEKQATVGRVELDAVKTVVQELQTENGYRIEELRELRKVVEQLLARADRRRRR